MRSGKFFILLLGSIGLAWLLCFAWVMPAFSQSGSSDSDEEAQRHLELGRIFEEAGEFDKAIAEYQQATIAKSPALRQQAIERLDHVLDVRANYGFRIWRDAEGTSYWFVTGAIRIGVVALLGVVVLFFLLWFSERRAPLIILPFTDLTGQAKEMGTSIAETLVDVLHQTRLIHTLNQTGEVLMISEQADLPSFSSQQYAASLASSLASLNALNVGGIGMPLGSILESVFNWLTAGRPRIVGALQRLGNTYQLTARLEKGRTHYCAHIWQIEAAVDPNDAAHNPSSLIKSLAFDILITLEKSWGTKSAPSLEAFTLGLRELQRFQTDSRNIHALEQAALHFENALTLDPAYANAKYNLAVARIGLGEYKSAIALLRSLRLRPRPHMELEIAYNLGVAYYQLAIDWAYEFSEKEFNLVIQTLTTTSLPTHLRGTAPDVLLALAHCGLASIAAQRVQRDAEQAEQHLANVAEQVRVARAAQPHNPEITALAHTALGIAYSNHQDLVRAKQELSRAIEIKSDYWRAYIYLGGVAMAEGNWDSAILSLEEATTLNPKFEFAQYQLGQAYRIRAEKSLKKNGEAKVDDLKAATTCYLRAPRIAPAHNELGRIYAARQEWDQALLEFRRALEINSRHADSLADLAWFTIEAGKTDQASLKECLELAKHAFDVDKGKSAEWHRRTVLGRVYLEMNRLDKATEELAIVIVHTDELSQAFYFSAQVCVKQNNWDQAREHLKKIFALPRPGIWKVKAAELMKEISQANGKANS